MISSAPRANHVRDQGRAAAPGPSHREYPPDREARFLAHVQDHQPILFKIARAYGRQEEDRKDLTQEMVVQLWRSFERYDASLPFATWMYRVALNVAISFQRRERTRHGHTYLAGEELLQLSPAPESEPPSEDIELLYRFIERFDPLNRALMLLYLDGNSQAEMAAILGISETNVGTKVGRLKERLRNELRPTGGAGTGLDERK